MTIHPATPARWKDLRTLFGEKGACAGCWCMYWRLPRSTWEKQRGDGNKRALEKIVRTGEAPGLIAYDKGEPVGWCAIAPRGDYWALDRSRILKPVDDESVWSVTCLFVARPYRRKGVSTRLLKAAAGFVRRRGGRIVEGYPVEPAGRMPDVFAWTGLASAFLRAGFREVARRSRTRPIMRRKA